MNENLNLVDFCLKNGGELFPLVLPSEITGGTGLMNPSVCVSDGKIYVNIRHVNYTLYHSEKKIYHHQWGPLQYLHPENQRCLKTTNFLCELDSNFSIEKYSVVDTSKLDVRPLWEFIGLEDARLFVWNDKFYLCGVRRDTTKNGEGRMELSELEITESFVREVSRVRIPIPTGNFSYCEKNWMPICDHPYQWVKWTNPTEVVEYSPGLGTTKTAFLSQNKVDIKNDLRGGSQVIKHGDYYLCITHEVFLYNSELGRKDGRYRHRFVLWDKDWNIVAYSNYFNFMGAEIEFCCGAAFHGNDLLISYGFQDNGAYILKMPIALIDNLLVHDNREKMHDTLSVYIQDKDETHRAGIGENISFHKHQTSTLKLMGYQTVVVKEELMDEHIYISCAERHFIVVSSTPDFHKKCLSFVNKNPDFFVKSLSENGEVVIFEKRIYANT